jgi:hypothetical protein
VNHVSREPCCWELWPDLDFIFLTGAMVGGQSSLSLIDWLSTSNVITAGCWLANYVSKIELMPFCCLHRCK